MAAGPCDIWCWNATWQIFSDHVSICFTTPFLNNVQQDNISFYHINHGNINFSLSPHNIWIISLFCLLFVQTSTVQWKNYMSSPSLPCLQDGLLGPSSTTENRWEQETKAASRKRILVIERQELACDPSDKGKECVRMTNYRNPSSLQNSSGLLRVHRHLGSILPIDFRITLCIYEKLKINLF